MVAVNPRRLTLLACSIASLSLSPSADAAAIPGTSSAPSSPTKQQHARQQPPTMPMPMKRLFAGEEGTASPYVKSSRRGQDPLGEAVSKRQQATFRIPRRVVTREDAAGAPGHVDIQDSTTNSTQGHLLFNPLTNTLESSPNDMTTLNVVYPDPDHCKLQMPLANATDLYCATYNPTPPKPEPLQMTPCTNTSTVNSTQLFTCHNGTITPMWTTDNDATAPATTGTLNSRDNSPMNVTLVFVPSNVTPNAVAAQEVSPDSASASATMTVTTTVTATATPSFAADVNAPSSSITASDSQSTSSVSSMSASPSIAAQQVDAASSSMTDPSSSATDSLSQPTSSSSATASSLAPATSSDASRVGALAVEVAAVPSSTASASSMSVVPSSSSASSSPSAEPSTVDAAAQADDSASSMSAVPSASSSSSASNAPSATPVDAAAQADDSASSMSGAPSASVSSSASSAASATPSAVNASAVADNVVASNASASATASASSSASAAPSAAPPTSNDQAVFVRKNQGRSQGTAQWRRA